jgi:hypothetical protein
MTAGPAIAQRRLGGFGEGFDEFGEARVVEQVGAGSGGGELDQAFFGLLQAVDGFDPGGVFVGRFPENIVSGLGFHEARSRMARLGAAPVSRVNVALGVRAGSRIKIRAWWRSGDSFDVILSAAKDLIQSSGAVRSGRDAFLRRKASSR